ncbi:MAG TPA: hypothetical protein VGX21_20395, partial [Methylomirabilota bacterium]|nr:hypothetical protein [Methylomirabilota bacterium]
PVEKAAGDLTSEPFAENLPIEAVISGLKRTEAEIFSVEVAKDNRRGVGYEIDREKHQCVPAGIHAGSGE